MAAALTVLALGAWYFFLRGGPVQRPCFPVTGKITISDGSMLAAGQVMFFEQVPPDAANPIEGVIAKGAIRPDGTYVMGVYGPEGGLPEGKYKVVVTPARPANQDDPPNWPPFKARFSRYNETPLEYTVTAGDNRFDIQLER